MRWLDNIGTDVPVAQNGSITWKNQLKKVAQEKSSKRQLPDLNIVSKLKKETKNKKLSNFSKIAVDNTKTYQKNKPGLVSKVARNKTDKEIADDRKQKINESVFYQDMPLTQNNWREVLAKQTQATGDKLRVSDEPNFFDDYVNPAAMVGSMASNLGQAPLQAQQSNSYMPYVTSIGAPLAVGTLAGLGANSTGQFVNNLVNPLAGTGDLVNSLGNKYLPNAYKYNPLAFKPNNNNFYRQVDNATYNEGLKSGLIRGKQDINMTRGKGIVNLNRTFGDDAYYNKGSLYYKGDIDLPYLFEANLGEDRFIPKVNGRTKKYTTENTSVRASKEPIPINDPSITTYQKDWLKRYKQIKNPKEDLEKMGHLRGVKEANQNKQNGGIVKDNDGYWNPDNWGKSVEIDQSDSNSFIDMRGVYEPLLGVSNTKEKRLMFPNEKHKFKKGTTKVTEYPVSRNGNKLTLLDLPINYNIKQSDKWLDNL